MVALLIDLVIHFALPPKTRKPREKFTTCDLEHLLAVILSSHGLRVFGGRAILLEGWRVR